MPLIVIVGRPSTGKSTVVERIARHFRDKKQKDVFVVSDELNADFNRNICYADSHKEREQRGFLRSLTAQHCDEKRIVIVDALNYIKSFRYELHCVAKLVQCTYCIVHVDADDDVADKLNARRVETTRYSDDIVKELRFRFEAPNPAVRWDQPYITVLNNSIVDDTPGDAMCIPYDDIDAVILQARKLQSNKATETQPVAPADYQMQLDKITSDIIAAIARNANDEEELAVPHSDELVDCTERRTPAQLSKVRRQFMTYVKSHPCDIVAIGSTFVHFINKSSS